MNRPAQTGAGPVDVLAVMDEAADLLAGCPDPEVAEESERDMRKARAAVAELVEAADECQDLLSASGDAGAEPGSYGRDCYDAMMRCRAALARFGGAA